MLAEPRRRMSGLLCRYANVCVCVFVCVCVCLFVKMCVFMCVYNGSHGGVRPRAGIARLQMSSGAVAPAKPYAEVLSAVEGQVAPKWDAGAAEIFAAMEDLKAAGVMSAGTAPRYIYVYRHIYICI